jgi:hypothetical protein
MSAIRPINAAPTELGAAACSSIRERIVLALMLYSLVHSAQVLAGDPTSAVDSAAQPGAAHRPLPSSAFAAPTRELSLDRPISAAEPFSETEFRPRHSVPLIADSAASSSFGGDTPLFEGATVWQRMAEFRSQGRVRLLTLWETRGSTLSLQTGKHGGPSLQWSSPLMVRDGAARGLLDHLFSNSLRGSASLRSNALRSPAEAANKPPNPPSTAAEP